MKKKKTKQINKSILAWFFFYLSDAWLIIRDDVFNLK